MPATIFDKPIFPGARIVTVEVEVSNVSGSYTNTVQDNRISASMEANSIEIDDPSVFRDKITVTSYNGSFVVSCPSVEGETTARISFLKIMDDQQVISSHEYDELNNNIGDLEDLETTDQSSIVNAVNEVIDNKPDYATEMPMSDSDSTSVSQAIANLNDQIASQSSTVLKAQCNYTTGNVLFRRTANILQVTIDGFSNLPNGGYTTICTIPSGFRPTSENQNFDVICGSDNTLANPRTLRLRIEVGGDFKVYNYGATLTNSNAAVTGIFVLI